MDSPTDGPNLDYFEDLVQKLFLDMDYESAASALNLDTESTAGDDSSPSISAPTVTSPAAAAPSISAAPTTTSVQSRSNSSSSSNALAPASLPQNDAAKLVPVAAPAVIPFSSTQRPVEAAQQSRVRAPAPAPAPLPQVSSSYNNNNKRPYESASLGDYDLLFSFDPMESGAIAMGALARKQMQQPQQLLSPSQMSPMNGGGVQEPMPQQDLKRRRTNGTIVPKVRKSRTESTPYKGVCFHPSYGRYRARIKINGKTTHLGYYETAEQAAVAYDRAAYELRGNEAVINFPIGDYQLITDAPLSPRTRCLAAARSVGPTDILGAAPPGMVL